MNHYSGGRFTMRFFQLSATLLRSDSCESQDGILRPEFVWPPKAFIFSFFEYAIWFCCVVVNMQDITYRDQIWY